jgi:hypothetical protein
MFPKNIVGDCIIEYGSGNLVSCPLVVSTTHLGIKYGSGEIATRWFSDLDGM